MDISRAIWNLIFFLGAICSLTGLTAARGARGGGFRGGSSYRSSGSSYRSSGSSYRSSARYSSSYARSGSRVSSTYVSYVPSVRYSRAYSSSRIGSGYWYYYGLYFSYARSSYYMRRRRPYSSNVEVCVNYETDSSISTTNGTTNSTTNSTTLGIFTCPLLDEEPRTYTKCCGDQYAEYCCEKNNIQTSRIILLVCVFGGLFFLSALLIFYRNKKRANARRGTVLSVTTTHTNYLHPQTVHPQGLQQDTNTRYRHPNYNNMNPAFYQPTVQPAATIPFSGSVPYPTAPADVPSVQPTYYPVGSSPPHPGYIPPQEHGHPGFPVQPVDTSSYPTEPPPTYNSLTNEKY